MQCLIFYTKRPRIIKASQLMHCWTFNLQFIRKASCFQTFLFCYLCNLKCLQYMNTDWLNILNIEYLWKMRQYIVYYQYGNFETTLRTIWIPYTRVWTFINLREQLLGFLLLKFFKVAWHTNIIFDPIWYRGHTCS